MLRLWKAGRSRSGFLLFEVMVTITILSLGLVMVLRSFASSLGAARFAQNYTEAILLAEEKLWEWEKVDAIIPEEPMSGDLPGGFRWKLEATPLEDASNLNEVKVAVSWKERGRQEEVSLATYLKVAE